MTAPASAFLAFRTSLLNQARSVADQPALIHRHQGQWVARRWRDLLAEVDALTAGLQALGLKPGDRVAVEGDVTARLLLTILAVKLAGGIPAPVAEGASFEDRVTLLTEQSVTLAVSQSRKGADRWREASRDKPVPVVLIQATADGRAADDRVIPLDRLGQLARPAGWAVDLPASDRSATPAPLWLEEATGAGHDLDALIAAWITSARPLAVPERLAAADRDRAVIAPGLWLASSPAVEQAAIRITTHLPPAASISGRLVAGALTGNRALWARGLRWLLRHRLGLGHLTSINVIEDEGRRPSLKTQQLFQSLGVPVVITRQTTDWRDGLAPDSPGLALPLEPAEVTS